MEELTAHQAVEAFKKGEVLNSVEMGGLGPGYEQAIQVAVMRMIASFTQDEFNAQGDEPREWFSSEVNKRFVHDGLDLTGAQFGAALQIAYRALRDGWTKMVESMRKKDPDRVIMISNDFPSCEVKTKW